MIVRTLLAVSFLSVATVGPAADEPALPPRVVRQVAGWTVKISSDLLMNEPQRTAQALELLERQLREIQRVLPEAIVTDLQKVTLWMSPAYPGFGAKAEYHPSASWLKEHGRDPEMARSVEFTNVLIFDKETRRMPNFALHELAHAYHDCVLGSDDARIRAAFDAAKLDGTYEMVERRDAEGRVSTGRHYALSNHKEYFAEGTEAFLARNDFYPYTREELRQHDPKLFEVLLDIWGVPNAAGPVSAISARDPELVVTAPPAELKIDPFHTKYVNVHGYPIVGSQNVSDYALKEAGYLVSQMLAQRPDILRAMAATGSRLCIIAHNEYTTDLPEFAWLQPKDYWDARARGTGGSRTDPYCSTGEENLLGYPGDPYHSECILIHEFAHNIHLWGMSRIDPGFDDRVKEAFEAAGQQGLWRGKYAGTNHHEYFAEGVQSWFNNNREPDHDHNHVNTREELIEYDPRLAELCREVFGDTELTYTKPATRLTGHLAGYDPAQAPHFRWPERLDAARAEIRQQAQQRSTSAAAPDGKTPAPAK